MSAEKLSSFSQFAAYFDGLAAHYDAVWTNSFAGRTQRNAVWRQLDSLVCPGDRVLDIGCGTGEDALHLTELGADVVGIDVSPEMVQVSRSKGVNARIFPIEGLHMLAGPFDVVLSDFGAFNCIRDLSAVRETLLRLVRPNGLLAICLMNRICVAEFLHFALRGMLPQATRRWRGQTTTSVGLQVFYPTSKQVRTALAGFKLALDVGIGISGSLLPETPPMAETWGKIDARVGASPIGRFIGDHRLFIFRRSS